MQTEVDLGVTREHKPSLVLDKTKDLMQSASGLGEIFNTLQGKLYRKPPASKSSAKTEVQKRVILEKFRDQLVTQRQELVQAARLEHEAKLKSSDTEAEFAH